MGSTSHIRGDDAPESSGDALLTALPGLFLQYRIHHGVSGIAAAAGLLHGAPKVRKLPEYIVVVLLGKLPGHVPQGLHHFRLKALQGGGAALKLMVVFRLGL